MSKLFYISLAVIALFLIYSCSTKTVEPLKVSALQSAVERATFDSEIYDLFSLSLPERWIKSSSIRDNFVITWSVQPGQPSQSYALWLFERDPSFDLVLQLKMRYLALTGEADTRQRWPGKQFERFLPHFQEVRTDQFHANGTTWNETLLAVPDREHWLWFNIYTEVEDQVLVFSIFQHINSIEDLAQYRELAKLIKPASGQTTDQQQPSGQRGPRAVSR